MHMLRVAALGAAMAMSPVTAAYAQTISAEQLKSMVEGLGYTATVLSKPGEDLKFEVPIEKGGYTTPMLLEISPSGRFIWVSANLGDEDVDPDLALEFLFVNAEVQPSSFWITEDGFLKLGMAIDNRAVTSDYVNYVLQKIASDVVDTADLWELE